MASIGREHQDELFRETYSKPRTLAELKVGDHFIVFPQDGDDSGHGGFKGGGRLFTKQEPRHPGEGYHESFLYTATEYARPWIESQIPLDFYVLKVVGVEKETQ